MIVNKRITVFAAILGLVVALPASAGWEEGVAAYKSGDFSTAISEFQGVIGSQPEYAGGHLMLGQSFLKAGRAQEAAASLRKAYDLDPANVGTQVAYGTALVAASRYGEAATLLSRIDVNSLPSSQQALVNQLKAKALSKTGDTGSALQALGDAVAKNPSDANAQYQYGVMLYNAGQTSQAVSALQKAASLNGSADTLRALSDAALRLGREKRDASGKRDAYSTAAEAASRLVASNASYDNLMRLGQAQLGAKQYGNAISTFEQAGSKNSSDWLPSYYIGQAHTASGNFTSAASSLQEAQRKTTSSSDSVKVWSALGFAFEKQKNYSQAITAYEKAGDSAAVARVRDNQQTDEYNRTVDEEEAELAAIKAEEDRLRRELAELEGGG